MNSSILWLLGAELILILSGFTLTWGLLLWRQRRQRARSLMEMVDLLERNSAERALHYSQWLESYPRLESDDANSVANQWLEAEKQFWQAFLGWHLHPDPKKLPDFPHQLQRLINKRLEILAEKLATADTSGITPVSSQSAPPETEPIVEEPSAQIMPQQQPAQVQAETEDDEDILIYSDQNRIPENETPEDNSDVTPQEQEQEQEQDVAEKTGEVKDEERESQPT